ncbi:hypothetical protein Hanom_Chr08g00741711 [Helianthus anomalus]
MARILELKGVRPHGVDVGHQFFSPCEMLTVWFPATEPLDVMSKNRGGLRGGKR